MTILSDKYALDPDGKLDTEALQRLYDRVAQFETIRETGSTGETQTLELGVLWDPFGGPFAPPVYTVRDGIVFLSGMLQRSSGTAAALEWVARVPAGLAPSGELVFTAETDLGPRRLDLEADRDLVVIAAGPSWVSLAGLSYPLG